MKSSCALVYGCQSFWIFWNCSDFNIESRLSHFHLYFLLFDKLIPKRQKKRRRKSHVQSSCQSKFFIWMWLFSLCMRSFTLLVGEVSGCQCQQIIPAKEKGQQKNTLQWVSSKYKDFSFINKFWRGDYCALCWCGVSISFCKRQNGVNFGILQV